MNEIFYSEVYKTLQAELDARARSGRNRTTRDLNYMLTKVANVEVTAFEDQKHEKVLFTLGGGEVLKDAYTAKGGTGFLSTTEWAVTDRGVTNDFIDNSYRVPPFITSADIQLNDHAMGLLNTATIVITIPNPYRDLSLIESIFARPGRAIRIKIAHPETALANGTAIIDKLKLPEQFKQLQDFAVTEVTDKLSKLNEVEFDGLIISFSYVYNTDGTVTLTVFLRGVSDVYTDVSMFIPPNDSTTTVESPEFSEKLTLTFYETLYNSVDESIKKTIDDSKKAALEAGNSIISLTPDAYGKTIQHIYDIGWMYHKNWNNLEARYITLGYLVEEINRQLLVKQNSLVPSARIICADSICFSNVFPEIVSADPVNIYLPGLGSSPSSTEQYGTYTSGNPRNWSIAGAGSNRPADYQESTRAYPSRMLINLELIKTIYVKLQGTTDEFTVTKFLEVLSGYISAALGGAVNMKIITFPISKLDKVLLYYDSNYLGDINKVNPYSLPMFANHPSGSVVREFEMQSKLPQNAQSLMYTINQSDTISEELIAPFMSFMYNNSKVTRTVSGNKIAETSVSAVGNDVEKKFNDQYAETHKKYVTELNKAKSAFTLTKPETRTTLETALKKYIQYPTPEIKTSALMISPIYPVEVGFTIDGINGFKYGDALNFDALPARYKNNTTFSVISIVHTINTSGEWTTKIRCIMRPRF